MALLLDSLPVSDLNVMSLQLCCSGEPHAAISVEIIKKLIKNNWFLCAIEEDHSVL